MVFDQNTRELFLKSTESFACEMHDETARDNQMQLCILRVFQTLHVKAQNYKFNAKFIKTR